MKIYTKTGDKGTTSLIGGKRVPKNSTRLEAYGNVDELNAYLGLIRSFDLEKERREELVRIQNTLFNVGSILALDPAYENEKIRKGVEEKDILFLEEAIDQMEPVIPPLKNFVLPGGNQLISYCHISRTVCRRTERRILDLNSECEAEEIVIKYINRLSDYLFQLSRYLAVRENIEELAWKKE